MAEEKPLIQLKLINGPQSLVLSGGPGLPVRRFVRGKVTIVDTEDEARKLVNAIKRKDPRYQVQELSKDSVFDLGYDCGVEPSPNFRSGLAGLLIGESPKFQDAFGKLLAAGSKALGFDEPDELDDAADESAPEKPPAEPKAPKAKKKAADESAPKGGGGSTVTSADVPKAGGE